MVQGLSNWILKIYKSKSDLEYDEEIFLYGVEVIITSLINILLLLFIGIVSGTIDHAIIYFISYAFLRKFIGGYHCDTNFKCISFNLIKYLGYLYLYAYLHINISNLVVVLIIMSTLILVVLEAPFEHHNRPINEESRMVYKKYSLFIVIGYTLVSFLFSNYNLLILYVLFVTDLLSIPCIIEKHGKSIKSV